MRYTGLSFKTHARVKNSESVSLETAESLCEYLKLDFDKSFKEAGDGGKLSSKTIKHHHDLISAVLSSAVKWNVITSNPAERADTPKVIRKKASYYDDEQLLKLIQLLETSPIKYKTAIYLTIDMGLRLSEVAGLEWNDINFSENALEISRQRQYVSGYSILEKDPKTENGFRRITISETVINLLKKYQLHQKENRLLYGDCWHESNKVFKHEDGTPMFPSRPYKWFADFLKQHELPVITFHQLRHTNASLLISEGIDIVSLSGRLGHADRSVTMNTYSHIIRSKEKQAANKMDKFYSQTTQN